MASILLISSLTLALGALLVNVFSARALGPTGRGALALHLQITYIASAVLLLGRDRSFLATAVKDGSLRGDTRQMVSLMLMPMTLGLVTSVAVGLTFHGSPEVTTGALIAGYVLVITGNMVARFNRSVAITAGRPLYVATAVLVSQILLIGTSIALLLAKVTSVTTWFLAYGLTLTLPFACAIALALRGGASSEFDRQTSRATKKLGMQLLPSVTSGEMAILRADRLLIPLLASYYELGIYVVAATMAELASWPLQQYIDSHTPGWGLRLSQGTLSPLATFSGHECLLTRSECRRRRPGLSCDSTPIRYGISGGPEFG